MNLTYTDLLDKNTKYEENTNAFAYLVITAILIQNPNKFVQWCKTHNESMLRIDTTPKYVELIEEQYKLPAFLRQTTRTNSALTTKMSINNIYL